MGLWSSRRPARYLVFGAWNMLFGLACFSLLYLAFGKTVGYVGILTVAQIIAVLQAHWAQRVFVWRSKGPYFREFGRFSAVYVAVYVANTLLLALSTDGFGFPVLPAQWVIGMSLIVPAYFAQRHWAFRADPLPLESSIGHAD